MCRRALVNLLFAFVFAVPCFAQESNVAPLATSSSVAQDTAKAAPSPQTKLEELLESKGSIIVKDFYNLGSLDKKMLFARETQLEIEALVVTAYAGASKTYGIRVTCKPSASYDIERTSYLDFDECLALSAALSDLVDLAPKLGVEQREYTEAIWTSRGGLVVGFFQQGQKQQGFWKVGGPIGGKSVFMDMKNFAILRDIANKGIEKLRALGAK